MRLPARRMRYATFCLRQPVRRHAEAVHVRMVMLTQVFVLVSHTSVMSHDAFAKKSHTAGLTDLAQM